MSDDDMCYEENENKYESKCKEGCYFFFFFLLFKAMPTIYGSFQARG